jgi:hypothetical protein
VWRWGLAAALAQAALGPAALGCDAAANGPESATDGAAGPLDGAVADAAGAVPPAPSADAAVDPSRDGGRADGGALGNGIVPLHGATTLLEPELLFDRGDAVVTRFGDRGRDRHAREDEFQSYDHYLPHYWEYRTARFQFVDTVARGGSSVEVAFVTEWKLGPIEFRAWYLGMSTVAHYSGNYAPQFSVEGPGTYDEDLERVSDEGTQYKHTYTIETAIGLDGDHEPLAVGQIKENEVSQFLDAPPEGRENY